MHLAGRNRWNRILDHYDFRTGISGCNLSVQATDENIVKEKEEEVTTDELKRAIETAEALTESDYTADSWASMQTELQEAKMS